MEKFEHKAFMENNGLALIEFPKPIQQKVGIFDKLLSKREDTVDEDREEVDSRLNELDLEILSNMEAELEDRLENNEVVEVEAPEPAKPEPKKEALKPEPVKQHPDHALIHKLYQSGVKRMGRSELRAKGFKGKLEDKAHVVGQYKLTKALFSFTYDIQPLKK